MPRESDGRIVLKDAPFSNQTIKTVELDMRAGKLIFECIEKQNDLLDWCKGQIARLLLKQFLVHT